MRCNNSKNRNISIHTPRMRSDVAPCHVEKLIDISIHTPRMRSDMGVNQVREEQRISIHTPRMRSDAVNLSMVAWSSLFQSTLLV